MRAAQALAWGPGRVSGVVLTLPGSSQPLLRAEHGAGAGGIGTVSSAPLFILRRMRRMDIPSALRLIE